MGLPTATVNARAVGVGVGTVDVGDAWSSLPLAMKGSPGGGGTMARPFVGRVWAWESAAVPWGGSGAAAGVARFVRERERDRETTLRTRSRRLPVDEDGVRGRALPLALSDFSDTGIGVGSPLSVSGVEKWSRLARGGGRLWVPRSFSSFGGMVGTAESRSLWKELV